MAASITDKITDIRNAARPNSARATGTRSAAGNSLACDNLAGWPTASKVHFVTYTVDSSSNPIAGTQLDCSGIVSGNSISSFTVIDGTDLGNSVGDYVEMLPTAAWGQDLVDALSVQHSRTGTHKSLTTDTLTTTSNVSVGGTLAVTGATTLTGLLTPSGGLSAGSITPANLASGAGSTWAYQTYTPTLTNVTQGTSPTLVAKYVQIGKTVHVYIELTFGTSGAVTGLITASLPVTSVSTYSTASAIGLATLFDTGTASYSGRVFWATTTTVTLQAIDASTTYAKDVSTSATVPFTFAAGKKFSASFSYEAA